jgi:hypothetical protein
VLLKLEEKGFVVVARSNAGELLRRAYFDLIACRPRRTKLKPSNDTSPDAYSS